MILLIFLFLMISFVRPNVHSYRTRKCRVCFRQRLGIQCKSWCAFYSINLNTLSYFLPYSVSSWAILKRTRHSMISELSPWGKYTCVQRRVTIASDNEKLSISSRFFKAWSFLLWQFRQFVLFEDDLGSCSEWKSEDSSEDCKDSHVYRNVRNEKYFS